MIIVFIHQDLFFQGGQLVTARLASGLAARGHTVKVVVSKVHADIQREKPDARPFELPNRVPLHVLPSRKASKNIFALGMLLRRIRPDVIVTCVGHYNQCAMLAKIIFRVKAPIVYIEHNMTQVAVPIAKTFAMRLHRFCLEKETRIVAVSDGVKRCLCVGFGLSADKVARIYNPILDCLNERVLDSEIDPWLAKSARPFSVVAAGALSGSRKGFDVLVEAFRVFHLKHGDSQLVIFGDGIDRIKLQDQINAANLGEVAKLAGFTNSLIKNFRNADCFVHSAREEAFGIVIVEALAAGLPVVATDCPVGPREILKDGKLGQLVPVDDVQAMVDAIERVYLKKFSPSETFSPEPYRYAHVIDEYEMLLMDVVK